MASLANHVRGAAPTSVENDARSPERDHNPGTQAPIAPMVHTKKMSNKVKEKDVRDTLAKRLGGVTEWGSPAGSIDVFTKSEVIEVEHYINWKMGSVR